MDEAIKTDRQRVDTSGKPTKTKPVWSWDCEQSGHKNETPPARVPEKCEGANPTPWGPMPCGSDSFRKTGEGIKVIEDA